MRVGVAVRAFQANREAPALGRANRQSVAPLVFKPAVIPGEHDPPRQTGAGSFHRLDVKREALAAFEAVRQGGDDADHLHVTALPLGRQLIRSRCSASTAAQAKRPSSVQASAAITRATLGCRAAKPEQEQ
jgi:hypothetical protein